MLVTDERSSYFCCEIFLPLKYKNEIIFSNLISKFEIMRLCHEHIIIALTRLFKIELNCVSSPFDA